jgi:hypothetical protein
MLQYKKKFDETDKIVRFMADKHDIKVQYINIDNLKYFKNQIRKFLSLTYIKKDMIFEKVKVPTKRKTLGKINRNSLNCITHTEDSNEILES